jgi:hypothetical protein
MTDIIKIKNYDEINFNKKSLLVLDIDETIIKFPGINQKWWDDNYDDYYKLYDINKARQIVLDKWIDIIDNIDPIMLDREKFNKMINRANELNCKIIFLTARIPELKEITEKNLKKCAIIFNKNDIYYSKNKGKTIFEIISNIDDTIDNIIFVDDVLYNINSVLDTFNDDIKNKYNLQLYLMDHENMD